MSRKSSPPPLPTAPILLAPQSSRFLRENLEQALEYLDEHGFVVLKSVVNAEEIEKAKGLFWDWIEGLSRSEKISRDDISTWTDENWTGRLGNGIMYQNGIGQSDFLWYLRTRPHIKEAFARVWKTNDLISSFDGCGVFRPWAYDGTWATRGGWYHMDQGSLKQGRHCVQGMLCLTDATHKSGGLTLMPGSHKFFDTISKRIDTKPDPNLDFLMLPKHDEALRMQPILVTCDAGDLILWDSRTIHCNTPALELVQALPPLAIDDPCLSPDQEDTKEPPTSAPEEENKEDASAADDASTADDATKWDLLRLVAYICMTPYEKATQDVLHKRFKGYKELVTTSHWPHFFQPTNEKSHTQRIQPSNPEVASLKDEIRALVGFR